MFIVQEIEDEMASIIFKKTLEAMLTFITGQKCAFTVLPESDNEFLVAQKNKATSYHLGQLKAKLAKLRRELISPSGGGGGGPGLGFDVARTGVASVGFVGFPSVGKASLICFSFICQLSSTII